MSKKKISHWFIIDGEPYYGGLTRKQAREASKNIEKENRFLYLGKCVKLADGKHSQLIIDL